MIHDAVGSLEAGVARGVDRCCCGARQSPDTGCSGQLGHDEDVALNSLYEEEVLAVFSAATYRHIKEESTQLQDCGSGAFPSSSELTVYWHRPGIFVC